MEKSTSVGVGYYYNMFRFGDETVEKSAVI